MLGGGFLRAANSFVGAYDAIPSIAAAYSTRRLLSSYTGPLLRLVADRTGYPEQDIYPIAGQENLNTAAAASFLAGDAGYVTKWYDQSGNTRDAAQATLANMPLYVASDKNSHPVLSVAGGTQYLDATGVVVSQPTTHFVVAYKGSNSGSMNVIDGITIRQSIYSKSPGNFAFFAGTQVESATSCLSSWFVGVGIFNGASSHLYYNTAHVVDTGNPGAQALNGLRIGTSTAASGAWDGKFSEILIASSVLSDSNRTAAQSAANAYWSIY